jgi:hypothetical protein
MSSFKAELEVQGKKYEVVSSNYTLHQATDEKGRPASKVRGGSLTITVVSKSDDNLIGWMVNPTKQLDGVITFFKIDEDAKMKEVKFTKAYCVGFSENFVSNDSSAMTTTVQLSAENIDVDGVKHENKWDA